MENRNGRGGRRRSAGKRSFTVHKNTSRTARTYAYRAYERMSNPFCRGLPSEDNGRILSKSGLISQFSKTWRLSHLCKANATSTCQRFIICGELRSGRRLAVVHFRLWSTRRLHASRVQQVWGGHPASAFRLPVCSHGKGSVAKTVGRAAAPAVSRSPDPARAKIGSCGRDAGHTPPGPCPRPVDPAADAATRPTRSPAAAWPRRSAPPRREPRRPSHRGLPPPPPPPRGQQRGQRWRAVVTAIPPTAAWSWPLPPPPRCMHIHRPSCTPRRCHGRRRGGPTTATVTAAAAVPWRRVVRVTRARSAAAAAAAGPRPPTPPAARPTDRRRRQPLGVARGGTVPRGCRPPARGSAPRRCGVGGTAVPAGVGGAAVRAARRVAGLTTVPPRRGAFPPPVAAQVLS